MNDVQQVMVVSRVNLDKHVVLTGRKMTLHYLGNLFQSFSHGVKLLRIFQIQTDVCTGFIPHLLRIDDKFRAFQNSQVRQLLYALVNGRARYIACTSYFQKRNARIVSNQFQNLFV